MHQINESVKHLLQGKVVAHPTETCYGLAADIFNFAAIRHLYQIKKMPLNKPVSILVRSLEEALEYGVFSETARQIASRYWPGALTIIVPKKPLVPQWINPESSTIGIRYSSDPTVRALLGAFGGPLTTTSANLHGEAAAYHPAEFVAQGLMPDFIINGGAIKKTPPSTIVEVLEEQLTVIRQGDLQLDLR